MSNPCLNVFGPDHLVIGNRFVGNMSMRVAAGDGAWADVVSDKGFGDLRAGHELPNYRQHVRERQDARWRILGQSEPDLARGRQPDRGHQPAKRREPGERLGGQHHRQLTTSEPYEAAAKLTAADVGLNAPDPLCA